MFPNVLIVFVSNLRDVPAFGVYMLVYEGVVRRLLQNNSRENSTIPLLLAGGLAGSVSWGMIVPLDVIKSRMQADRADRPQYQGMIHCIRSSIKQDGPRVFGRGFWMVVLRAFPVNAATRVSLWS
ncbi:hypothetical protein B566_EDAN008631 [Ephemera danica]|nr:hypothetical protein B566_EDAN008631 [Ephemera danica]